MKTITYSATLAATLFSAQIYAMGTAVTQSNVVQLPNSVTITLATSGPGSIVYKGIRYKISREHQLFIQRLQNDQHFHMQGVLGYDLDPSKYLLGRRLYNNIADVFSIDFPKTNSADKTCSLSHMHYAYYLPNRHKEVLASDFVMISDKKLQHYLNNSNYHPKLSFFQKLKVWYYNH